MKITRQKALDMLMLISALPIGAQTEIEPSTLTSLLLLKVELQRIDKETSESRWMIQQEATKDIKDFYERLSEYDADPEAHNDFAPELNKANERFFPALAELMQEEVELKRQLLTEDQLSSLCRAISLDGPAVKVWDKSEDAPGLTPIELLEMCMRYLAR